MQATRFWEAKQAAADFACDVIVDCGGHILSPGTRRECSGRMRSRRRVRHTMLPAVRVRATAGFIDVQINGAYGVDFSDPALTPTDIEVRLMRK